MSAPSLLKTFEDQIAEEERIRQEAAIARKAEEERLATEFRNNNLQLRVAIEEEETQHLSELFGRAVTAKVQPFESFPDFVTHFEGGLTQKLECVLLVSDLLVLRYQPIKDSDSFSYYLVHTGSGYDGLFADHFASQSTSTEEVLDKILGIMRENKAKWCFDGNEILTLLGLA